MGAYRVERETYRAVRSGFGLAFLEKQACLGLEAYRAFFRDQVAYRGLEPFLDLGAYRVWGPFLKRFEISIFFLSVENLMNFIFSKKSFFSISNLFLVRGSFVPFGR